ncbi:hypothetical protein DBB_35450 [Desulfoluna spongiiphila]|nr:hypothetical protein DBB_35450 [Desulfoluna spongiiphila]
MHMDQKIFTLGLPTETVSCYLLLTGLADQDLPLTRRGVEPLWAGDAAGFDAALGELERRGVIAIPEEADAPLRLLPPEMWRD